MDEFYTVYVATGYNKTGTYKRYNFTEDGGDQRSYLRAQNFTKLVSLSYSLFGISEGSTRIPGAIAGVLLVLLTFGVTLLLTKNPLAAFLAGLLVLFHPRLVIVFRYARMYSPLLLLTQVSLILASFGTHKLLTILKAKSKIKNIGLAIGTIVAGAIVLFLAMDFHINAAIVLPAVIGALVVHSFFTKNIFGMALSALGVLFAMSIWLGWYDPLNIGRYLGFFIDGGLQSKYLYFTHLFSYPFYKIPVIFLMVFSFRFYFQNKENYTGFLHLSILAAIFITTIFFVFIANRYVHFNYVSHIVPLVVMASVIGVHQVIDYFKLGGLSSVVYFNLCLFAGVMFGSHFHDLYIDRPKDNEYTDVYGTIEENFNHQTDIVLGLYPRDYYLRNLPFGSKIENLRPRKKKLTFKDFQNLFEGFERAWIVGESRRFKLKNFHPNILHLLKNKSEQLYGSGMDHTNVELYLLHTNKIKKKAEKK